MKRNNVKTYKTGGSASSLGVKSAWQSPASACTSGVLYPASSCNSSFDLQGLVNNYGSVYKTTGGGISDEASKFMNKLVGNRMLMLYIKFLGLKTLTAATLVPFGLLFGRDVFKSILDNWKAGRTLKQTGGLPAQLEFLNKKVPFVEDPLIGSYLALSGLTMLDLTPATLIPVGLLMVLYDTYLSGKKSKSSGILKGGYKHKGGRVSFPMKYFDPSHVGTYTELPIAASSYSSNNNIINARSFPSTNLYPYPNQTGGGSNIFGVDTPQNTAQNIANLYNGRTTVLSPSNSYETINSTNSYCASGACAPNGNNMEYTSYTDSSNIVPITVNGIMSSNNDNNVGWNGIDDTRGVIGDVFSGDQSWANLLSVDVPTKIASVMAGGAKKKTVKRITRKQRGGDGLALPIMNNPALPVLEDPPVHGGGKNRLMYNLFGGAATDKGASTEVIPPKSDTHVAAETSTPPSTGGGKKKTKKQNKPITVKKVNKKRGGGSDWMGTVYSRGPVNTPDSVDAESVFGLFNKSDPYISNRTLSNGAANEWYNAYAPVSK